jgi:hypothetical protein
MGGCSPFRHGVQPTNGRLYPSSDETTIDLDSVRHAINDAREKALIRQQGREAAEENED